MATAEELLATTATTGEEIKEILVADLNTRVISIPATIRNLGVESDDDTKRLYFSIPRRYGEFDLSKFDIRINFKNSRGAGDLYPVDDVTVSDDGTALSFSWLVDRSAYTYAGDVEFNVCMKLFDDNGVVIKELNTTPATLPVLEGLETEKSVVESNPSAFDTVLYRLYAVEAATGNGTNGYYSIVKVTENESGVIFTIANQDGTTAAMVMHGRDGVDGTTPIKGVDYWTSEDEAEILQEVSTITQQRIDGWAPRSRVITLYADDAWVDNQQTVYVEGVTEDNIIVVAPDPDFDNYVEYSNCNVRCVHQDNGELTFECRELPTRTLVVNVAVYYGGYTDDTGKNMTVVDDGAGNVTIVI